jgi:hypothetical protein
MFTKKEYLQKTLQLSNIDYKNPHNIRLVEDIYLGGSLTAFIFLYTKRHPCG